MRFALALLLLAGTLVAAPIPKELKKPDDALALVGTWKAVKLNGNAADTNGTHTFIFDAGGGVRTLFTNQNKASDWTWTIDPKASPKRMKWVGKDNPANDFDCIYEVAGDTFRLGFLSRGNPVPDKVEAAPGVTLYELKREKPGK